MLHGNLSLEAGDPIDEEEDEFKSPGMNYGNLDIDKMMLFNIFPDPQHFVKRW